MLANVQFNLAKGYEEGMENCNLNSGGRVGGHLQEGLEIYHEMEDGV